MGLIDVSDEEWIRVIALEVIDVLLAAVEVVRDLSALMVETKVFLTLKF